MSKVSVHTPLILAIVELDVDTTVVSVSVTGDKSGSTINVPPAAGLAGRRFRVTVEALDVVESMEADS